MTPFDTPGKKAFWKHYGKMRNCSQRAISPFPTVFSKLSKRVENTVGKREIARYKQFFLFPQCFQKVCFPGASKGVIVWEWVKT